MRKTIRISGMSKPENKYEDIASVMNDVSMAEYKPLDKEWIRDVKI